MHTSIELIELAKQRLALRHSLSLPITDYRLGKLTGIAHNTLSNWRRGKSRIDRMFASVFADACELPAAYVLACIERESAGDPALQKIYEDIADRFRAGVMVAAILAAGTGASFPAKQAFAVGTEALPAIDYAPRRRRRIPRGTTVQASRRHARNGPQPGQSASV